MKVQSKSWIPVLTPPVGGGQVSRSKKLDGRCLRHSESRVGHHLLASNCSKHVVAFGFGIERTIFVRKAWESEAYPGLTYPFGRLTSRRAYDLNASWWEHERLLA